MTSTQRPVTPPVAPGTLRRLAARVAPHVTQDGATPTPIDGLELLASHCDRTRTPHVYAPGLVFILQGNKIGYLEDRVIHYGAGHYLVQAMPLPFECETQAGPEGPLLGASVHIDPGTLAELVDAMPNTPDTGANGSDSLPMAAVPADERMIAALERLLECLDDRESAVALGAARRREVLFEALRGPQGALLRGLLRGHSDYGRIARSIERLHTEFAAPLIVSRLATEANMSVSSFHVHFRRITRTSPLQYQKRIRLLHARQLLARHADTVGGAAQAVGYLSASQFSREYKRYFGVAPALDPDIAATEAVS